MVWEVLDRVVECQGLEKPHMAVQTKAAWLQDYKVCGFDSLTVSLAETSLIFSAFIALVAASERAGDQIVNN